MANWESVELGEVCEVVRGGSPRPIINYITDDPDGVNWLKIGDVSENDKFFTHANEKIKRAGIPKTREVVKGDLILSNSMSFGRAFITLIDGYIHDGWLRLRCDEHRLDKEYLYYFLTSKLAQDQFKAVATGSVVNNLKSDTVKAVKISLPPIDIQKKIATILARFDDKIKCNEDINSVLIEQAKALYLSWFATFDQNSGEKPVDWAETSIDDITTLVSRGIAPKYDENSDQIVLNQKCIRNSVIDVTLGRHHKPKTINEKWLQQGDLLINSTGEGTLGRTAQVWFVPDKMTVDSHVTIVRASRDDLKYYIGLWGITHEREIEALHTGSTGQTELPRDRVKAMPIILPDSDTLASFNAAINPIVMMVISNQQESKRLADLRNTLLPKLMNGEIDVSEFEVAS